VPIVLISGSLNLLEHSGPLLACNGIALPPIFSTYSCFFQLSLLANQRAGSENAQAPTKSRKSASLDTEEKVAEGRHCDPADIQDWATQKPAQMSARHTESSADSDYSFESHASSSVESRSPRDLEENCDVFLELPQWCKRSPSCATGITDCPPASTSHYPDDPTDRAETLSTTCAASSTAVSTGMSQVTSILSSI
jgi:hypothetical protein